VASEVEKSTSLFSLELDAKTNKTEKRVNEMHRELQMLLQKKLVEQDEEVTISSRA